MEAHTIKSVKSVYISAGCNKCPKAVDWGGKQNQLICAVSNSVALFSERHPFEIKCTFNKHIDRVNCVKWISSSEFIQKSSLKFSEFISASKDKSLVVWQGNDLEYTAAQTLEAHTDNVCVLDGMYFLDRDSDEINTLVASASVDSTVRIWSRNSNYNLDLVNSKFTEDQVILSKQNGFALALKFYILPISNLPLLIIGYENHKIEINIRLLKETDNTSRFYCLHTLVGHEDWIRDLDICQTSNEQLLIASSSQDNYIRLWKLDSSVVKKKEELSTSLIIKDGSINELIETMKTPEIQEEEDDDLVEIAHKEEELKLKSSLFTVHSSKLDCYVQYSMNLESVLYGHEDWIYTVKFSPHFNGKQPLVLLSASIDKTMVIWKYNKENCVWIDESRAGDIGGNTLGFYGATFDQTGRYIVAHGYQGALHLWERNPENESLSPGIINGGHFDLVEDLCWEPEQKYFITTSKDQTTRFHGAWRCPETGLDTWHELGRPQIHGYDLKCCAFIDRFKFVSGADEKLLRVFEAPKIFLSNLHNLSRDESLMKLIESSKTMAEGASVPALGLSNKAVYSEETKLDKSQDEKKSLADELYKEVYFNVIDLTKPPTEEHLLQNTLWPEVQKLYGHGYEIFSLAVDRKNHIIVSSCKATKADHAGIIVWQEQLNNNQPSYKQMDILKGHELTIVQMKFSNNSKYLLSVSRDRTWKLFKRQTETNNNNSAGQFKLVRYLHTKNNYHTRIVWSCDWSHDDKFFVTTSRDKRACVWYGDREENIEEKPVCSNSMNSYLEMDCAITACAFAPGLTATNEYLLAFGLDNGSIQFFTWTAENGFFKYAEVENNYSHHMTVTRLSFRNIFLDRVFCLASCSNDNSTRLYEIVA